MDSTDDIKDLLNSLSQIRKEISGLRTQLNELNEKKEALFEQKDTFSKKIIANITEIKQLKRERDEYTNKVKSLKIERQNLNERIQKISEELKSNLSEKDQVKDKSNIKGNPSLIKSQIEELEYKIETEGMSFDKEKKLMIEINDLKKQLDGSKEFLVISDKVRDMRKEVRDLRRDANIIHKSVQDNAQNSQERHEKIITLSKEIDEIKKDEKDFFDKFMVAKEEFNKVNDVLKEKLVEMNRVNDELRKNNIKTKEEKKEKENQTLAEKSKRVTEKIKGRKKLTTEDLLVFQKTMDDEEDAAELEKPAGAVKEETEKKDSE